MKKSSNKKYLYIVLVVIFAILVIFLRAQKVYDEVLVNEIYEQIPTSDSGGFMLKKGERNLGLEQPAAAKFVSLKPGESYEGVLVAKNNESDFDFMLTFFGDLADDKEGVHPEIKFEEKDFMLKTKEWRVLKYVLTIPEDIELGKHKGVVTLRKNQLLQNEEGVNIAYAIGVEFYMEVTDEPVGYEYEQLVDPDLKLSDLAMGHVLNDLKKVLGVIFGVLAIFFLYKAVSDDRRKKKKKKRVSVKKKK